MKRIAIALLLLAGCDSDTAKTTPEQDAKITVCKQVIAHIFSISPQSQGEDPEKLVKDKTPIEDIEQCTAADPAVLACMMKAADVAAVRACIPAPKEG